MKNLLKQIVAVPERHARFLNTLSFMELCGAQKLSRVVPKLTASTFLLEHVAEEYRHAYFLRKLAQKIAPEINDYKSESMFARKAAWRYISHIDRKICLLLGSSQVYHAYLLSTLVIETRALPFYKSYQDVLDSQNMALSLKSIISEEKSHLSIVKSLVSQETDLKHKVDQCLNIENQVFGAWMMEIQCASLN